MAGPLSKAIAGWGKAFSKQTAKLYPGSTCYLLVSAGADTPDYRSIYEVTSNWLKVFSRFRGQMNLQIATELDDLVLAIHRCTHMSINGIVYDVDDRDKAPPDMKRPWWDLSGDPTGETFTI